MSDNWIILVPRIADHLPETKNVQTATEILKQMLPEAEDIEAYESEHIQFYDCGANFGTVSCPQCQSVIELDWWSQTMAADFDEKAGFQLDEYKLPCCSSFSSLSALDYSFHQTFGRFALSAMNPNIGELCDEEIGKIEDALGCDVTVVYQHI